MASALIVGNGGREHALAWKLRQSPELNKLYFTGENAGMDELGESVALVPTDAKGIARFVAEQEIDLTVIGPDRALEAGVVDAVIREGYRVFGPRRQAAQLETDKIWAHSWMEKWGIPHPAASGFDKFYEANRYVIKRGAENVVLKANGLADGKGVYIPKSKTGAQNWLHDVMVEKKLGSAGERVLIQDKLEGKEVSIFAICNGNGTYVVLPICQDYKKRYDGDRGPNTGGMGSVAPVDLLSQEMLTSIKNRIIEPTLLGMADAGIPYLGALYVGIMLTDDGPQVIEYNARFGDPEAQALMPLISSNFFENLMSSVTKQPTRISVHPNLATASIAIVSKEYPTKSDHEEYARGLKKTYRQKIEIFHGNTVRRFGDVKVKSGRGLHVVGIGENVPAALQGAYAAIGKRAIHYENMDYRHDIGSNL